MEWNLTLFVLHLLAFVWCVRLYTGAPCWMQKLTVVGLAVGMFVITLGCGLSLLDVWGHWHVTLLGLGIEHLAVLLYLFKMWNQQGEHVYRDPGPRPAAGGRSR